MFKILSVLTITLALVGTSNFAYAYCSYSTGQCTSYTGGKDQSQPCRGAHRGKNGGEVECQ